MSKKRILSLILAAVMFALACVAGGIAVFASDAPLEAGSLGEMTDAPLGEIEFELAKTLSRFPERINSAIAEYEPSVVTRYILDLAAAFNRFYHDCKIAACEDEKQRSSRLALTNATSQVLKTALGLICMQAPEKI